MTKLYRKEKFFSGVPGQTFHMQAGKLKSVDTMRAVPHATPPRESWPSRAKQDVAIPDYEPATGRRDAGDLELGCALALDAFAGSLVGGPLFRNLCSLLATECGDRAPTFVFALRDGTARHVFEYAPTSCAFVPTSKPDSAYLAGIECWASDLAAVFAGELGPIALTFGRARLWNALPARFTFDIFPELHRVRCPLRQPAAVSAHLRADLAAGEGHHADDRGAIVKLALVVLLAACGDNLAAPPEPFCDAWHQWGSAPSHVGQSCVSGQPLQRVLADIELDSLVAAEIADSNGELVVHYQTPLIDGDSVYVEAKTGTYTPCVHQTDPTKQCTDPADVYRYDTQIWSEVAYAWQDGVLAMKWTYISDWKPPPSIEIVFHAALVDDFIAIPTAHGGIAELDAQSGALLRLIEPFGDDPDSYVVSPLAVDRGNVYYTAVSFDHVQPYNASTKSWLVAVAPDGSSRIADFASLVTAAPGAADGCYGNYVYPDVALPWPPPPNADGTLVLPKQYPCGPQIPGFSAAPGIAYDGTLYLASAALFNEAYSYLTSVDPGDLSPNWTASLRDRVHDACGVDIPYQRDAPPNSEFCPDGAPLGVDPSTGMQPAAFVDFGSTSSPVPLPHGGVIYGALTYYNEERGHLLHFDDRGGFLGSYDFGWDLTPAVVSDANGDRIVVKDNHYGYGFDTTDPDPGPYWISLLDDTLQPLWQFQNTEHDSCVHAPDGAVTCTTDHPNGFEWCVNAPAVDRDGVVYANSEDGNLYAIAPNGDLRDRLLLDRALGASYTPLSIDHAGRIYALNAGHLFVVGANQWKVTPAGRRAIRRPACHRQTRRSTASGACLAAPRTARARAPWCS